MKVRTFTADTIADAMSLVRKELGDDAIIISSRQGKRGEGVEVRAAVERYYVPKILREPESVDDTEAAYFADDTQSPESKPIRQQLKLLAPHLAGQIDNLESLPDRTEPDLRKSESQKLKRLLTYHGFTRRVGRSMLATYDALARVSLDEAVTRIMELRFSTSPIAIAPKKPVMLIGPPGAGKTTVAAKLAARAAIHGHRPVLLSTDTVRAGGLAQLEKLADAMKASAKGCDTPAVLRAEIQSIFRNAENIPSIFIDTPSTNPYSKSEVEDLQKFILAAEAEPILVLSGGGDGAELADQARLFSKLGATRVIISKLDACRRIGGLMSAIDTVRLPIACLGHSPYIGRGFDIAKPDLLARKLLAVPRQVLDESATSPIAEDRKANS